MKKSIVVFGLGQYGKSIALELTNAGADVLAVDNNKERVNELSDIVTCSVIADARLRELDMGVLEKRHIDSLSEEEEGWRRQLVNGTPDGRIPQGESMQELSERMHAALASCLELPAGSRPLLVSHGIALGCLVSTILGLPAYAERRLRLRNCSISRVDYQQSPWLASGWVVETAGDVSHLDAPAMDELQR